MAKRKRESPADPIERRKQEIRDHLLNSQKVLHRALKPTKGFTRQKLGKRLKHAQDKGPEGYNDAKRIKKEIEAWYALDLAAMAEAHLCRTICKVKRMVESEVLPEEIREKGSKKESLEGESIDEKEKRDARFNVMSGMFNTPGVKTTIGDLMRGLYMVMGIPLPEKPVKGKTAKQGAKIQELSPKSILKTKQAAKIESDDAESNSQSEDEWEGIESSDEKELRETKQGIVDEYESTSDLDSAQKPRNNQKKSKDENQESNSDLDDEQFSKYDALIGSSSDSDSNSDSESELTVRPAIKKMTKAPSLSLSPSPPPAKRPKSKVKATAPTKGTTFLPTLLGGYFSGSESEASDIEDEPAPIVKKNRPGQMARRAIWEKKFGTGANHIKSGAPSVNQSRDEGWDAKWGVNAGGRRRGRGGHGEGGNISRGGFGARSGNEMPPRKGERGMGKKDDSGVLHPSWQAAKKAKEEKKAAKFEGKKVTFD